MEYVCGEDVVEYLKNNPLNFEHVIERTLDGFEHLEENKILHRDIRPGNLLVSASGDPKIIDFGFGKQNGTNSSENGKSISINWWCATPPEFAEDVYDSQTEVYFVGKLFEYILSETKLTGSKYQSIINRMCEADRNRRFQTFALVNRELKKNKFEDISFSHEEKSVYRNFVGKVHAAFSEIGHNATYKTDAHVIIDEIESLYKSSMLEIEIPDTVKVCRIFVSGQYKYWKNQPIEVADLKGFLDLLKGMKSDKREIVIANIFNRLDSVKRGEPPNPFTQALDDEIPF